MTFGIQKARGVVRGGASKGNTALRVGDVRQGGGGDIVGTFSGTTRVEVHRGSGRSSILGLFARGSV